MALRVLIDGELLAEAEARSLWNRFSAWMEEHEGDLAGFARSEGFSSIHPEIHDGQPVLVASRSAQQRPYASAVKRDTHRASKNGASKNGASKNGAKKKRPQSPRGRR